MEQQLWRVIGGGQQGGIVVREGCGTTSAVLGGRLSTGSIVRQLTLFQGRLYYELAEGDGPSEGWVSLKVKNQELLVKCDNGDATAPQSTAEEADEKVQGTAEEADEKVQGTAEEADKKDQGSLPWYSFRPVVKGRKIRVLCLHGTASNSTILKLQLAPLAKVSKGDLELIYVDGAIKAADDPKNFQLESMQKAFPGQTLFQYVAYDYESERGNIDYKKIDEFVQHVESQMQASAPIDGIIGFSQGGILALMLAARAVSGKGIPLAFVCHFSASFPAWTYRYKDFFQASLALPSLHVWGDTDTIGERGVPDERVEDYYLNPKVLRHTGDHRPFPRDKEEAPQLASEVLSFIKNACTHMSSG